MKKDREPSYKELLNQQRKEKRSVKTRAVSLLIDPQFVELVEFNESERYLEMFVGSDLIMIKDFRQVTINIFKAEGSSENFWRVFNQSPAFLKLDASDTANKKIEIRTLESSSEKIVEFGIGKLEEGKKIDWSMKISVDSPFNKSGVEHFLYLTRAKGA